MIKPRKMHPDMMVCDDAFNSWFPLWLIWVKWTLVESAVFFVFEIDEERWVRCFVTFLFHPQILLLYERVPSKPSNKVTTIFQLFASLFYYLSFWFSALWWSCCSVFSTYQVKTFPFPLSKYKLEIAHWTFREFQTYTITDLPRGNNGLSLECNNHYQQCDLNLSSLG